MVTEVIIQGCMASTLMPLDDTIYKLARDFKKNIKSIDQKTNAQLSKQFGLSMQRSLPNFQIGSQAKSDDWQAWSTGIGGGIGLGAGTLLAGGAAIAVSSIAFFPVVLTGAAVAGITAAGAAVGTSIGAALGFFNAPNQDEVRKEVLESGLKIFLAESKRNELEDSIQKFIEECFDQRLTTINGITQKYLKILDSLLVDEEKKAHLKASQIEEQQSLCAVYQEQLKAIQKQIDQLVSF